MKHLIALLALTFFTTGLVSAQSGGDAQPPNGLSEVQAYSIFYQNYKNEQYEEALNVGRWILKGMPRSIEGYPAFSLQTNLDRLATIYTEIAAQKQDPSLKATYLDSADMMYDKAFAEFSEDEIDYYQWHLNRGRFYFDNADTFENSDAMVNKEYMAAYELSPNKIVKTADGYYMRVMLNNLVSEDSDASKQQALTMIKKAEKNASEDLDKFFDNIRNKLFDSDEERLGYLQEKVEEDPENVKLLRQLRGIYKNMDNLQKVREINEKLYQLNPSYQNTTALANIAIENAEYTKAIKYLNEAKNKTEDTEKLKSIYLNLASAYQSRGSLRSARNNARKAINADQNWGRPYITMANIYARAVSNCTTGREMKRHDRAVYWLIIDYLNKAKRVDSSVSSTANSQLRTYRQYTPSSEDKFFNKWKDGQSLRIDGSLNSCYSWINENTTIR
jgi:tetratricopeptide (TPR) repeat protein